MEILVSATSPGGALRQARLAGLIGRLRAQGHAVTLGPEPVRTPDAVLALDPGTFAAFPGALRLLDAQGLAAETPGLGARLDQADLVLAGDAAEQEALSAITRAVVLPLGHWPEGGSEAGPGGASQHAGQPPVIAWLDSKGEADVEAALGPVARQVTLRRLPGPEARWAEYKLVVSADPGGIALAEAFAAGAPVLCRGDGQRGIASPFTFHAAGDAVELAALLARWLAEPDFRAEVAAGSRAAWAAQVVRLREQHAVFHSQERLRAAAAPPSLLLITDLPFWQESLGNQARITEVLRAARRHADLDVLLLRPPPEGALPRIRAILGARGRCHVAAPASDAAAWIEAEPALEGYERDAFDRASFHAVEAHLATHRADLCVIEYIRLSYLRHARGMPAVTVLDLHDLMAARTANFAHFGRAHFLRIEAAEEQRILGGFTALLAIQPAEFAALERDLPGRALHAPHVLRAPRRTLPRAEAQRVIFLGGNSPMNRDGLRWFLTQVWPCFAGHPARLHVAGEVCRSLPAGAERVVAEGVLGDLGPFFAAADVAINPVFYGGGLKIKSVEYLGHGIPALLSREAAYGLPGSDGEAFLLARDRGEFIRHLHALLTDAALRRRMGEAAFALARTAFGPDRLARPFAALAAHARAGRLPGAAAHATPEPEGAGHDIRE